MTFRTKWLSYDLWSMSFRDFANRPIVCREWVLKLWDTPLDTNFKVQLVFSKAPTEDRPYLVRFKRNRCYVPVIEFVDYPKARPIPITTYLYRLFSDFINKPQGEVWVSLNYWVPRNAKTSH